jgi:hypothetical protein
MLKTDVLGRFMIEVFLNQRLLMRCSVCREKRIQQASGDVIDLPNLLSSRRAIN